MFTKTNCRKQRLCSKRQVSHFDIAGLVRHAGDLKKKMEAPDFWDNLEEANKVTKEIRPIDDQIKEYERLNAACEDLEAMIFLSEEEGEGSFDEEIVSHTQKLLTDMEAFRLAALLDGKYDKNNAIVSLHAGAGGTEAQDWNAMLYRMYVRWAERRGYGVKVLDLLEGEEAGLKSAELLIEGLNAYGYLKCEKGVHRLVRISPFDSAARRHTSFASVDVAPEITDTEEVEINPEDLRVDTYRSSGAGGQHVNKTDSAIRITHYPTGIVVSCQNERSQIQNRETCMNMLRSKLIELKERQMQEEMAKIKGEAKKIEWGSQIRSYVFHPYTLVKDHRTGTEVGNIGAVMDGEIDGFINSYLIAN